MADRRRRYTREFKLEAIRLSQEPGVTLTELAKELGIRSEMLYRWRKEADTDPAQSFPGQVSLNERDQELEKLRNQETRLKAENAFLKKVSEYFVKDGK
jgi:transposase